MTSRRANPPRELYRTVAWAVGTGIAVTALWVSINTLLDHSKAAQKEHDDGFVRTEKLKDHERDDIAAIKQLADVINAQGATAETTRQYLIASNKDLKASVADLALSVCRLANPKDGRGCQSQETALSRALSDASAQAQEANRTQTSGAAQLRVPPIGSRTTP